MSFHHFAKPSLSLRNKPFQQAFSLGLDESFLIRLDPFQSVQALSHYH
jgi:hypothetical protein